MSQPDSKFIIEYLSFLRSVNSQWKNAFHTEKSNSEVSMEIQPWVRNWHLAGKLSINKELESDFLPFILRNRDAIGRHFVSSRNIEAGEVLLIEPPIILAPLVISPIRNSKSVCIHCLKEVSSFTCCRCGMYLCGEECDAVGHKDECHVLRTLGLAEGQRHVHRLRDSDFLKKIENLPDEERQESINMVKRAEVSFMKSHKEKILKYYPLLASLKTLQLIEKSPLFYNVIMSLQGNVLPNTNQFLANTQRIVDPIMRELKLPYTHDLLHKISSIWDTNGFEVKINTNFRGQGLYPASSLLTHSCQPSCEHSFTTEGVMVLRAVEYIPKDTILTICYTDQLWPTQVRVDHLMKTKNFRCNCNRCLDPTELGTFTGSVLCPECQGYLISVQTDDKELRCNSCSKLCNKKDILESEAKLSRELSQFSVNSFHDVRGKINSLSNNFHSRHHLILRLKVELLKKLKTLDLKDINDQEIEAAYFLTSSLLETVTKLLPKYSYQKAQIMKEVFRISKEKRRRGGDDIHLEFLTPKEVSEAKLVLGWFGQTLLEDE